MIGYPAFNIDDRTLKMLCLDTEREASKLTGFDFKYDTKVAMNASEEILSQEGVGIGTL